MKLDALYPDIRPSYRTNCYISRKLFPPEIVFFKLCSLLF